MDAPWSFKNKGRVMVENYNRFKVELLADKDECCQGAFPLGSNSVNALVMT